MSADRPDGAGPAPGGGSPEAGARSVRSAGSSAPTDRDTATDRATPSAPAEPDVDAAARHALARARDAARSKGLAPGGVGRAGRRGPGRGPEAAAPAPGHGTGRDPRSIGAAMDSLRGQLGWNQPLSIGGVIGRWREVVGDQIADHCAPETFDEGALVVRADSTAWATQIRLLLPQLERRLVEEVGEGVVTSIQVLGPGGPSWRKGPRSVRGRGPRDTYG
ncbi:DUF721 domain-containing protein [Occultella kanbiaonis]|uniref:DUF721 domain-containing protein n=1 Tax=Occultella kanbiaonis TaxID=2675754 RepID=UPI001E31E77E|nr:DciA family protein [Occultella kanbiaonis]